jgi:Rrf2 family transcriptional regulator, iron-sulfur cluster assembly transcription factor
MSAVLQQSDYAIRCLLFLVEHRGRLATKTEIAKAVDAPDLFVAKILQRLVKANVLVSVRGIHGGFSLAREPSAISLLDVLGASQASLAFRPCVLNPKACPLQETCPSRPIWVKIYENTVRELRQTTFDRLSRDHKVKLKACGRRLSARK